MRIKSCPLKENQLGESLQQKDVKIIKLHYTRIIKNLKKERFFEIHIHWVRPWFGDAILILVMLTWAMNVVYKKKNMVKKILRALNEILSLKNIYLE